MSLHDRIMSMCAPDNVVSHPLCMGGYSVAQQRAAQIAKEADELMAEMAAVLIEIQQGYGTCDRVNHVLANHDAYKESAK